MTFVDELLNAWANDDWQHIRSSLGYPSTSPSFKTLADNDAAPEPFELSPADIRAVQDSMQWMAQRHPEEYLAICRRFKSWQFGAPRVGDHYLLDMGASRLAAKLKTMLE